MPNGLLSSAKALTARIRQAVSGQETIQSTTPEPVDNRDWTGGHDKAERLLRVGRSKYLAKDYQTAEKCFRCAILEDPNYTLAVCFLGHALYKLGLRKEAVAAWSRACEMDPDSDAAAKAREKLSRVDPEILEGLAQLRPRTD